MAQNRPFPSRLAGRLEHCSAAGNDQHNTRPVVENVANFFSTFARGLPRRVLSPAAWSNANDDTHRLRRIGLRPSQARNGRQRGSARSQMEKFATGKFHF
jgi:hypothetical protein